MPIERGWREHARTNPDLFSEELTIAQGKVLRLLDAPVIYAIAEGEPVRRIYMPRTDHHLYYTYDRAQDVVALVAVWHARREHGPPLRLSF